MNIRPIDRNRHYRPGFYVRPKLIERSFRDVQRVTFSFIAGIQPDLKPNTVAKLIQNQPGNTQFFLHRAEVRGSNSRIVLKNVKGAQKRSVGKRYHPSSPSNSAARIAATSASEKMRSPQVSFNCAMKSGLTIFRAF